MENVENNDTPPLLKTLWEVIQKEIPTPKAPKFQFKNTPTVAETNAKILKEFNYDLHATLKSEKESPMSYGSEFRKVEDLKRIFGQHDYWQKAETAIRKGAHYPVKKIPKKTRLQMNTYVIKKAIINQQQTTLR